jgi:starvation-inducible DNA-binding protein
MTRSSGSSVLNRPRTNHTSTATRPARDEARPITGQRGREIQKFGTITRMPIGLTEQVCKTSCDALNRILADTMTLRDLYKKHHWQVAGHTFYSLHLLFDKH